MTTDLGRLIEIVEAFPQQRILVLADLVADEFVSGEIRRVSREAPVLILRQQGTERVPGGGANAANNLADLGARIVPVGVVGDDATGHALLEYFRAKRVPTSGILIVRGWTTPAKTRYLAGWTHTARQQVLRVDREPVGPLPVRARRELESRARAHARKANAILVSDYGFGTITPQLVRRLGRSPARPITLDSRYALLDFRGAGITAATPNEPELEALYHRRIGNDTQALERLGRRALRHLSLRALVVTRGKEGMVLFEQGCRSQALAVFGAEEAVDVTGAGDTVIAAFTLALAAGATFAEAARLANYAGGIVVMKRGTATVSRAELLAALQGEITGAAPPPAPRGGGRK
jgi:rfaE bifunctional protein kinase chain/domain